MPPWSNRHCSLRMEAVLAGVKRAWRNHHATIVAVADKIPHAVLRDDPQL